MDDIPKYVKVIWVGCMLVCLCLTDSILGFIIGGTVMSTTIAGLIWIAVDYITGTNQFKDTSIERKRSYTSGEDEFKTDWVAIVEELENIGKKEEESQWMVSNHLSFYNQGNITDNVRYVTDRDGNEIRLHKASGAYWDDQGNMYENMN